MFATGHSLHGLGVVTMGILVATVLEGTTRRWGAEDDVATGRLHAVGKDFQIARIGIPRTVTGLLLFLVVMTELHDDVVVLLQLRQNLV